MLKTSRNSFSMLLTLFLTSLQKITSKFKTSLCSHFGAQHGHKCAQPVHVGAENAPEYGNLKISSSKPLFCPHNVYTII